MRLEGMRGITLVELIVVIAIMAVLMGFASAGVNMIRGARVTGVTQQLLADIQTARIQAMTHDTRGFGIRFPSATSYVVFKFDDCNDDISYDLDTCNGLPRGNRRDGNKSSVSVVLKKTNPPRISITISDFRPVRRLQECELGFWQYDHHCQE